jgi:hypothetical protein
LPTKKAIIDASSSTDDTKELTFKWELISSPLEYQKQLPDEPFITLDELVPGNYTLKVTVTDQDRASDSAIAKLFVIEETDYPPVANAGEDIAIFLPVNEVALHGNNYYIKVLKLDTEIFLSIIMIFFDNDPVATTLGATTQDILILIFFYIDTR